MYDWLPDALRNGGQVVTANRRSSRVLSEEYTRRQRAAGHEAWRTPAISSWQEWQTRLVDAAGNADDQPTRISAQQSAVLWERCLRSEIDDSAVNVGGLVRLAREAWKRIHEWELPLDDCVRAAVSKDQRLFAAAARRYRNMLRERRWIDDAGRPAHVRALLAAGHLETPARLTLAGFDRVVPQLQSVLDDLAAAGCEIEFAAARSANTVSEIVRFENADAELRAAGAWARARILEDPDRCVAIVATNLERNANRSRRLVLDGLAPGWQYGGGEHAASLNVSYGRKLSDYPAIRVALLTLRWLTDDLRARDVSLLLRTPLIGSGQTSGRARLELALRQLPDRDWSPARILQAMKARAGDSDAEHWLRLIERIEEERRAAPARATPSGWAERIDGFLRIVNWPGEAALDSRGFQLVNRWRELLNELARLELVSPSMTFPQAFARLTALAGETVFQAEAQGTAVPLMGPLEAAGMEFDELWICGLTASDWPPAGRPSPFVSRRLQRDHGMPDADPSDTADYARRVLDRLVRSTRTLVCSFPESDGDAEQAPTALLGRVSETAGNGDPGWHASSLLGLRSAAKASDDRVPQVATDELVAGGAATVQKQLSNPFAAFVAGRLGVRYLPIMASGIAANLRGSLIHDSLYALYADSPSSAELRSWSKDELDTRIGAATRSAFGRHERHADPVLRRLLALERRRVESLLRGVVDVDRDRDAFIVEAVEGEVGAELQGVHLNLRFDRLDRLDDGSLVIIDYKTGSRKKFLGSDGVPRDFQLVVYACTLPADAAGLGIFNIDSRDVSIDGAGAPFGDADNWHKRLGGWKAEVRSALDIIRRGDVRVNAHQGINEARPYALLSRFAELRRDY